MYSLVNFWPLFHFLDRPSISRDQCYECCAPQGRAATGGDKSRVESLPGETTSSYTARQKRPSTVQWTNSHRTHCRLKGNLKNDIFWSIRVYIYLSQQHYFIHIWQRCHFLCHSYPFWCSHLSAYKICRQLSCVWAISCHHNVGAGWQLSLHTAENSNRCDTELGLHLSLWLTLCVTVLGWFFLFAIKPMSHSDILRHT